MSHMAKQQHQGDRKKKGARDNRLFTLDVFLISAPVTEEFAERNPTVSRIIQIKGNQTLEDLHYAIFDAFDREEEHLYEFQFGKRPRDRDAERYVLPMEMGDGVFGGFGRRRRTASDLTRTTIGSLDLVVKQAFYYWFDFGDDWWHQINVVAIEEQAPSGKYPKVTTRVGASPPQYPDWGDEDDDEDEEDDET